jgi:hypothetical protein
MAALGRRLALSTASTARKNTHPMLQRSAIFRIFHLPVVK